MKGSISFILFFLLINFISFTVASIAGNKFSNIEYKTVQSSTVFFEDVYLLRKCRKHDEIIMDNILDETIFEILDNLQNDSIDDTIKSFNDIINFDLQDIPNYEKKKYDIYKIINTIDEDVLDNTNDYQKKILDIFNTFTDDIGNSILMNAYERYNDVDIYNNDKYMHRYYHLINHFHRENEEEVTNEMIEDWALSVIDDCDNIKESITKEDNLAIALLFRQIKIFNKLLTGNPLTKLDIFFTNVFCESDVTILYNLDILANSILTIYNNGGLHKNIDNAKEWYSQKDIYDLFNKIQFISPSRPISYIQSTINYYTNNNNNNKFVGLYGTFDAMNNYIYYNYNLNKEMKEKKYTFKDKKDNYSRATYEYLIKFQKTEKAYLGLDRINLGELDYIIKRNINTIYKEITEDDKKLTEFFSGLFQIMEYFSVKNNINYRIYTSNNANDELEKFKYNSELTTKEIDDLNDLKELSETVNNIIYQINLNIGVKRIFNPKNPSLKMLLNPFIIMKQDEDIENMNNFLNDIRELKNLYKFLNKNHFNGISEDLYYETASSSVIDNESISGVEGGSLMENICNLLKNTLDMIYDQDYYGKRCMTDLNGSNSSLKENANFREFVFSKYKILPKIYYDVNNYYSDLNSRCNENKNIIKKFYNQFKRYTYPHMYCIESSPITDPIFVLPTQKDNTLKNIIYNDIKIEINSIPIEEDNDTEFQNNLRTIKKKLETKYSRLGKEYIKDLNKFYNEVLYYDKYITDYLPSEMYNEFKISIDISDFKYLIKDVETKNDILRKDTKNNHTTDNNNTSDNTGNEEVEEKKIMDTLDTIINDNSDILFDNFIDKNPYYLSCDNDNYLEIKKSYDEKIKESITGDYIIKNIFFHYLIENTIIFQNIISLCNTEELIDNEKLSKVESEIMNMDIYSYSKTRFMDTKNIPYYFFNYGIDEYMEYINKYYYNEVMYGLSQNETLKSEFTQVFENEELNNSENLDAEYTNNNLRKLAIMQNLMFKYIEDNIPNDASLEKRATESTNDNKNQNENQNENQNGNSNENKSRELYEILFEIGKGIDYAFKAVDEYSDSKKPEIDSRFWNYLDDCYMGGFRSLKRKKIFIKSLYNYRKTYKRNKKLNKNLKNRDKNEKAINEKINNSKDKTFSNHGSKKKNHPTKRFRNWLKSPK